MSCLRGVIFLGNGTNDEYDFELFLVEFVVPAPDGGVMEVLCGLFCSTFFVLRY